MRLFFLLFSLLCAAGSAPAPAFAHGGEDHSHDAAPPAAIGTLEPRLEAASRDLELVAVLQPGHLLIYLDRYATNEPVAGAAVTVELAGHSLTAAPDGPGLYRLAPVTGLAPGAHELVFTVTAPGLNDVLLGTLTVPAVATAGTTPAMTAPHDYLLLGGAGVAGLLLGLLLGRRRVPAVALALLALGLPAPGFPHAGEDHGDPVPAPTPLTAAGGAAQRLPDGSLFVPKAVQRLLGIRTLPAERRELPKAVELNGHVIPDPNRSGRVQATQDGRLELAPGGLPHVGQPVRAGDVLVVLVPIAEYLDTANQQAQLAELNSKIDSTDKQLARLQRLGNTVSQREVEEVAIELEGLRRRREAVGNSLVLREPLRAPVDGVISQSKAVAGQVVQQGDTLFEIVDPRQWWVEARAYDAALNGRLADATAKTLDGRVLPLRLLGMGFERLGQSLPVQFRVEGNADGLSAGQPLRVFAQLRDRLRGIPLPRDSVLRGAGGETTVWLHTGAERFSAHRVTVEPVDGATLAVTAGLEPGDRVVTVGAAALAQVR